MACDVAYTITARGCRSNISMNRNRSSYAWSSAPDRNDRSSVSDGTTTIVCSSSVSPDSDFHSGTSFRCSASNSAVLAMVVGATYRGRTALNQTSPAAPLFDGPGADREDGRVTQPARLRFLR